MPPQEAKGDAEGTRADNAALGDELEALNAIYETDTLVLGYDSTEKTSATLRLPESAVSFLISFPARYPDVPPQILGTQSIGDSGRKGEGEIAVDILRDVLARVWTEGQVCLFDLIEEAGPLLHDEASGRELGEVEVDEGHAKNRSAHHTHEDRHDYEVDLLSDKTTASSSGIPPPTWVLSDTLTVNKSTFVARSCPVSSLEQARYSLSHLHSTNKKVASATHNISAWRIKIPSTTTAESGGNAEVVIQDCDDDGETAAGSRLLHLLQLMDAWNVLVVVTRWYGGVKLGPDRFRLINQVGREAVLKGGFAKTENEKDGEKGKAGHAQKIKGKK